jgi:hypothetical protein
MLGFMKERGSTAMHRQLKKDERLKVVSRMERTSISVHLGMVFHDEVNMNQSLVKELVPVVQQI